VHPSLLITFDAVERYTISAGKPGAGNLGTPVFVSRGGTRTYNRPVDAVFVSQGGQRSCEGGERRVRNGCHGSFVIGHLRRQVNRRGNGGRGTRGPPEAGRPRGDGTAKMADGGRRPGIGNRKPGTGKIPRHLEPATGGQALEPQTWNCRSYLTSSTALHNLESSTAARGATRGSPRGWKGAWAAA